ncbi:hypothetical protein GCM10010918_14630 [Paenibacillus radicis (ex Gao et al. 2016)]|uniref:Uncharacterized protein n=1 Tax=Paenibacillus radicis (ex Gao et al. 2016) TaxID=1737354 RepID=A0A917GZ40_9BACL|nr:hypothetical protein GCM10010918_14630 [Paenibacillus radicis (ex Gao et al. 2016)]
MDEAVSFFVLSEAASQINEAKFAVWALKAGDICISESAFAFGEPVFTVSENRFAA